MMLAPLQQHEDHASLLQKIAPETIDQIARCSNSDWLPGALGVEIQDAAFAVLGHQGTVEVARQSTAIMAEAPMFRAFGQGLLRMFGGGPLFLLKQLPRGQQFSVRGLGNVHVEDGEGDAGRVIWSGLPEACHKDGWIAWQCGVFLMFVDFCELRGEVIPDRSKLAASTVVFDVSWQKPA